MLLARHTTHAACCMLEPLECRMGAGAAATDLIGIELRTERQTRSYVSFAQAAGHAKPGTAPWHKLHSSWLRSRPQLQRVATLGGILSDAFLNDWVAKGGSVGAQRGKWPPGRKCGNAIMTYFLRLAHCDDFLQNGSCRHTAKHALDRCAACPVGLHTLNDIVMAPESRSGRQITATVIAEDQ